MTLEEWRPVLGWEGLYEVSDNGAVRSLTRTVSTPTWGPFTRKGRVLRPETTKGYLRVTMQDAGRIERRMVHQLVLEAFVGSAGDGMEVRHLDGTRTNNSLGNLRWGTRPENVQDKERHGTIRWALRRGHCIRGHVYDERNTYVQKNGTPRCRTCHREWEAARRKSA